MSNKTYFTRDEFENLLIESAEAMASNRNLRQDALNLFEQADKYRWVHQTEWFGEPVLNLPQDLFAFQEIIYRTKPSFIIEVGVAWGGGLLFFATLMEVLGGKGVIGIDVFMPDDLKERLSSHGPISEKLTLINGSSVEENTLNQIKSILGDCRDVMVILDSHHSHEHVLNELRLYSPLVGKGHYLVCSDTIIESISKQKHRSRPWGPGNNPKTALDQFFTENDRFVVDEQIENKLLLTCNPRGYLRCRKD